MKKRPKWTSCLKYKNIKIYKGFVTNPPRAHFTTKENPPIFIQQLYFPVFFKHSSNFRMFLSIEKFYKLDGVAELIADWKNPAKTL